MASFGQNIKKSLKTLEASAEMGINRTEKLKPDLKSAQNSKSTNERPTQSIDHEHYLSFLKSFGPLCTEAQNFTKKIDNVRGQWIALDVRW